MRHHDTARRAWTLRAAVLLAAGAVLLATACSGAQGGGQSAGGSSGTLRVAYQVIPNGAPIVKHEKWLEDNLKGVNVQWRQFAAAQDVIQAMAAGGVDVGLIGSTGVANAVAKGLDFQVPWIYDVEGQNEALVVKNSAHINSVSDLAGHTIATPFGSTTQYSLIAALKDAGVYGKVKVLDMKPPDALAAWNRGDIDGAYIWEPTLGQMKQHGGKVILSSADMSKKGVVTADLAIVSKKYAQQNPKTVASWLKQENRAVQMIQTKPADAAKIVAAEFSISEPQAAAQMKELIFVNGRAQLDPKYLGPPGKPGQLADTLQTTCSFLKDQKLVPSCPDAAAFKGAVDSKYLDMALKGQR